MRIAKIVLIALVACGVLFGAFYFYVNQRDLGSKPSDQRHAEFNRARDKAQEDRREFMTRVVGAEKIDDPEQRCLAYPDIPGTQWDPALVKALCRSENLPIASLDEIDRLLQTQKAAEVDRLFDRYAQQDKSDPQWRGVLALAYRRLFEVDNAHAGDVAERWVQAAPKSANALLARAYYRINRAYAMRGAAVASDTPQASTEAMDQLLRAGSQDAAAAAAIDARSALPWILRMQIAMPSGDEDAIANAAQQALAIDPADYAVYAQWIVAVDPRWGGSGSAMQHVVDTAKPYLARNPLLQMLDVSRRWREKDTCCHDTGKGSYTPLDYAGLTRSAPQFDVVRQATREQLDRDNIFYASTWVRFWPDPQAYQTRADFMQRLSGNFSGAAALASSDRHRAEALASATPVSTTDAAQVKVTGGNPAAAAETYRTALKRNPRDTEAIYGLVALDLREPKNPKEAQELATRLVDTQPDVAENWRLAALTFEGDDTKFCAAVKRYRDLGGGSGIAGETQRCRSEAAR